MSADAQSNVQPGLFDFIYQTHLTRLDRPILLYMRIRTLEGSPPTCNCGSWLEHWEKFSGHAAIYCPVIGCLNKDLVGAHVRRIGRDQTSYIFPLCKLHEQSTGDLKVADVFPLVSANEAETCRKATN